MNFFITKKKMKFIWIHFYTVIPKPQSKALLGGTVSNSSNTNNAYDNFIKVFISLYDTCFAKKKIKLKP